MANGSFPALYIQLLAGLANRLGDKADKEAYYSIASQGYWWFFNSGIVDQKSWLVVDGLKVSDDSKGGCIPEGGLWSYNQGVILGAAAELYEYTKFDNYTQAAVKVADAALDKQSPFFAGSDVFGDQCNRDQNCNGDIEAFKAPFIRNLRKLAGVVPDKKKTWTDFIQQQAQLIIKNDVNQTSDQCDVGLYWQGPIKQVDPVAQYSGLEVLSSAFILDE